ncbi:uncharacterized protein LOC124830211 [Vigna umbellata]|nr:uncharacterized protein LOC124830211 [Vigna umbellata]
MVSKSKSNNIKWTTIKCPRQPNDNDCGYYVCQYMKEIITYYEGGKIPTDFQVSLHAFSDGVGSSTIRLQGKIGNNHVSILVDGGSDHNFVQDRVVKFLDLPSIPYNPLTVMVDSTCNDI